ncbi:UNVERIFIED_CONTAM: hypothetical protein Sangu_3062600 [Sesamum angustifolium]|uniref:Integrase catalytic domain-containing protein n=1 Tax=Sesamum angustifolium TaxID=2727405 RepID=A0AAW2KGC7_9LAMI
MTGTLNQAGGPIQDHNIPRTRGLEESPDLRPLEWCKELKIQQNFTTVGNPQANGQIEVSNKIRLNGAKWSWVEELPDVLWAYQTTSRTTIGEMLFCLVYGLKAVITAEIGEETARVAQYNPEENEQTRKFYLVTI